jgi:hypothetical protein
MIPDTLGVPLSTARHSAVTLGPRNQQQERFHGARLKPYPFKDVLTAMLDGEGRDLPNFDAVRECRTGDRISLPS